MDIHYKVVKTYPNRFYEVFYKIDSATEWILFTESATILDAMHQVQILRKRKGQLGEEIVRQGTLKVKE